MRLSTLIRRALLVGALLAAAAGSALAQQSCPAHPQANADYSNMDLSGCNFTGLTLDGTKFNSATLRGTSFKQASLKGAKFGDAVLGVWSTNQTKTSFTEADLTGADFTGTALSSSEFEFAILGCTVFDRTNLTGTLFGPSPTVRDQAGCRTSFKEATMNCEFISQWKTMDLSAASIQSCGDRLAGVDFSDAMMASVVFSGLNLAGTTWSGAKLDGAFFLSADLGKAVFTGASLIGAQMSRADLTGAKLDAAKMNGAFLTGATLTGASMAGAVLQDADGQPGANLSAAYMPGVDLSNALLSNVLMPNVQFYGTGSSLSGATMQNLDASGSNLSNVNLSSAQLRGVTLDNAILVNGVLKGANLSPADNQRASSLANANLQGVDLRGANLTQVNLADAAVAGASGVQLFTVTDGVAALAGDLGGGSLTAELSGMFSAHGYPVLPCQDPQMLVVSPGSTWEVTTSTPVPVGGGAATYTRFELVAAASGLTIQVSGQPATGASVPLFTLDASISGPFDQHLFPRAALSAFAAHGYALPGCTNPAVAGGQPGAPWTVAETLTTLSQTGAGYTSFNVGQLSSAGQAILAVFGAEITVVGVDDKGLLSNSPFTVTPTLFDATTIFSASTVMPNLQTYQANQDHGVPLAQMMVAPQPPAPPSCVPNPDTFCP